MPIDPRIALGVQPFQLADPLAQYGQVQNILAAQSQRQAAGTQNELAQTQLGQAQRTMRRAQEAQDFIDKTMDAAAKNNAPTKDPMEAAMIMSNHPNEMVRTVGKHMLEANKIVQEYRQQSQFMQDQEPSAVTGPTGTNLAPITPETAFTAPVSRGTPNALAPAAAPQVNALAAPQGKTAESLATKINEGDRKYGTAPGWLKQRELLVKEFDQLIKPEFEFKEVQNADGTISYQALNKRTAQAQPVMGGGVGVNVAAQRLKFEQDKFAWEQANPGKEIKEVTNADGTVSVLGIDKRTGVATPVTTGTGNVTGVNTAAQRLQYEKDNPGKTIQQVTKADGSVNFVAVDNRTGIATPVTMGADAQTTPATVAGQPLVGAKVNAPPSMVAEYTFAKTADGGNFKGSYQDFVTARAKAGRAPAQPATPSAPVAVVGADGKIKYVSREEAISKSMTPASAEEGLTTKERQKREAKYPQAKQSVKTVSATMNEIEATVKRLLDNKKGLNGITGLLYGNTPALTDAARQAAADLKQLKNLAFVQGLTELRNASSTGAGVGNVTNKEGDRFENLKASLDTSQSFEDLSAALTRLSSQASATRSTVSQAFEDTYSYRNQGDGTTSAPAGAVDTDNPLLKGEK